MFTFWTSLWSLNIIPKFILNICIFEFPNFGRRLYKHHNHIIQFISCNCESREIYFIWFITLSRWGWIPITFFFVLGGSAFKTLPLVMKAKVPAVFELGNMPVSSSKLQPLHNSDWHCQCCHVVTTLHEKLKSGGVEDSRMKSLQELFDNYFFLGGGGLIKKMTMISN